MTTKAEIRDWLLGGISKGATHCFVVCDTYDHEDYPKYIMPGEDPQKFRPGEMQRIMECYALHLDLEQQLGEFRSHHYEMPNPVASTDAWKTELRRLLGEATNVMEAKNLSWEEKFDGVFSDQIAVPINALLREHGLSLDYWDPDTDYQEDVAAYYEAIKNRIEDL